VVYWYWYMSHRVPAADCITLSHECSYFTPVSQMCSPQLA